MTYQFRLREEPFGLNSELDNAEELLSTDFAETWQGEVSRKSSRSNRTCESQSKRTATTVRCRVLQLQAGATTVRPAGDHSCPPSHWFGVAKGLPPRPKDRYRRHQPPRWWTNAGP